MKQLPSFYRMATNEDSQHRGMISLLKHFGWMWVGLFVGDDESGESFLVTMEFLFFRNGICSAFTKRIPSQNYFDNDKKQNSISHEIYQFFKFPKCRIFVIHGNTENFMWLWYFTAAGDTNNRMFGKVWITTAHINVIAGVNRYLDLQMLQGTICFMVHSNEPLGFQEFVQNLQPDWTQADDFLKEFWELAFDCSVPDPGMPYKVSGTCTGKERMETLYGPLFEIHMTGHSYGIYNAVYAVAHALHSFYLSKSNQRARVGDRNELQDLRPWQVSSGEINGIISLIGTKL
ncbi:hypothetical protein JD844_001056 [Phrynosoma platyrhinos]|uniref:Receptor ligand binding region domain-containing protein n=1 Tax=Phrynosoma platyrhinos TaxID=52577 RepID=A0ABQ7T912_PHRPL|nr:hypothetical protein JD844_001056 [Phrynosoma platyrhinos]